MKVLNDLYDYGLKIYQDDDNFKFSLDTILLAESVNLKKNDINRATSEKILAGGKGINASVVLKNLGIESIALGFIAGFTGQEIKRKVEEFGVKTDFVYIWGFCNDHFI